MKGIFVFILFLSSVLKAQTTNHIWMQAKMNGSVTLDGGGTTEYWGYATFTPPTPGNGVYLPGPLLRFNEGDSVYVHFLNNSPEDHSIHWHGLDVNQDNDGVPTTSSSVDPDSMRVYGFKCTNAGTFNYHCHVLTTLHLSMGMYGMFVVDPDSNQNRIYTDGPTYTKDYNWLASEFDLDWNNNVLSPGLFVEYQASYFMINGKSGSQLQTGAFDITGTTDDTIALRLSNMGYGRVRFIFPPECNLSIQMSDGRALPAPINSDTIDVYSGERYTVLINPDTTISSNVEIIYTDLRTNADLGNNSIPVFITGAGLSELNSINGIEIMGNPTSNILSIKSLLNQEQELTIFDQYGKAIQSAILYPGINVFPISLNPGIYYLNTKECKPVRLLVIE